MPRIHEPLLQNVVVVPAPESTVLTATTGTTSGTKSKTNHNKSNQNHHHHYHIDDPARHRMRFLIDSNSKKSENTKTKTKTNTVEQQPSPSSFTSSSSRPFLVQEPSFVKRAAKSTMGRQRQRDCISAMRRDGTTTCLNLQQHQVANQPQEREHDQQKYQNCNRNQPAAVQPLSILALSQKQRSRQEQQPGQRRPKTALGITTTTTRKPVIQAAFSSSSQLQQQSQSQQRTPTVGRSFSYLHEAPSQKFGEPWWHDFSKTHHHDYSSASSCPTEIDEASALSLQKRQADVVKMLEAAKNKNTGKTTAASPSSSSSKTTSTWDSVLHPDPSPAWAASPKTSTDVASGCTTSVSQRLTRQRQKEQHERKKMKKHHQRGDPNSSVVTGCSTMTASSSSSSFVSSSSTSSSSRRIAALENELSVEREARENMATELRTMVQTQKRLEQLLQMQHRQQ